MGWATWAAIYFTVWWTVLFAVLPFGVKRDEAEQVGHQPGAPANPLLIKKFIWTSLLSALLVLAAWATTYFGLVDWRSLFRE
jgi:predicted secreted protein